MQENGTRIRKRPPRAVLLSVAALAVLIASALGYYLFAGDEPTGSIYTTASEVSSPDAISPIEITVIDGDTIRARGKTTRLVGFDAPETGSQARCPRERELGDRATTQLKTLIAGGGLELRLVPCACPPGTEGTPDCNFSRFCGQLRSYGRDIGGLMIQYVLAKPYVCGVTSCPPRGSWC